MIDHEFSTIFLYLDDIPMNKDRFDDAIWSLTASKSETSDFFSILSYEAFATLSKNLDTIVFRYRETSIEFLERLKSFIYDLKKELILLENNNYLTSFNSNNYKIGHALFKENNQEEAKRLQQEIIQYNPDIKTISSIIYNEVLVSSQTLENEIEKRLSKNK